jgi:hypothetical protein
LDGVIRILAVINIDADHVDSDIAWSDIDEMIIETIFGIVLTVAGGGDQTAPDPATMVFKGLMTGNKIIQKEKNKEMDDSIHEELNLMTKDYIYKLGGLK